MTRHLPNDVLYSSERIVVTRGTIQTDGGMFALDSIQGVWVTRRSRLGILFLVVGLVALAYGGTMSSCTGILVGSVSGTSPDDWFNTSIGVAVGALALILFANRLPPLPIYCRGAY